jgi:hypothetical protein
MSELLRGERMPLALGREADSDALLLQNAVLAFLGERERTAVRGDGELVEFKLRQSVYQPEAPINAAYFPIDCVLSVVTCMEDGSMIEVGTIGREGTTAIPLIMGANTTANDSCQRRVKTDPVSPG